MSLTTERETIAALVTEEADVRVSAFMPDRIVPPMGIVLPGANYLDPADTFGRGRFLGRWVVSLVCQGKTNEPGTTELDDLTEDTVVALANAGYTVESVSTPYGLTSQNATYLAIDITTTKQITI